MKLGMKGDWRQEAGEEMTLNFTAWGNGSWVLWLEWVARGWAQAVKGVTLAYVASRCSVRSRVWGLAQCRGKQRAKPGLRKWSPER